jgi:metal-responsive CopG/Arc/MetJ family transcriptional regulator
MVKSIKKVVSKRRGRPATGKDPVTAIRLSSEFRAQIDDWRRKQVDLPSRSEAIRRLAAQALTADRKRTREG